MPPGKGVSDGAVRGEPAASGSMLRFEDVVYVHGLGGPSSFELGPLTLEMSKGEILVVLGPSGSGKTTLLRLVAGLESVQRGSIWIGDHPVSTQRVHVQPEHRGVGMVFQDYALFPHLVVNDNILFGLDRWPRRERAERLRELEGLLDIGGLGSRYPHELSGGQRQRVALARAMAPRPSVILLDEPFSNLDADLKAQVTEDVHSALKDTQSTAIIVTHDHEEAFGMADRVAVLNDGRMEQEGTPLDIYHLPVNRFVAEMVGPAVFIAGKVTPGGIQTRFGPFPNVPKHAEGDVVDLLFRPDDIELEPEQTGDASIAGRRFRGSENIYTVKLDTGETVLSTQRSHTLYQTGQRVRVRAELEHIVAFRK